jgi:hypothetical protein
MEKEETIETPERRTAGLTSATQIIDSTSSVSFLTSNTTCATPQHLYQYLLPEKPEEKQLPIQVFPPLLSKKERFRKALEDSIKRNKSILKELAKY